MLHIRFLFAYYLQFEPKFILFFSLNAIFLATILLYNYQEIFVIFIFRHYLYQLHVQRFIKNSHISLKIGN